MVTMVIKYVATKMFKFSQFSIALFIRHGGWFCDLCRGQSIQGQGHKLKAISTKNNPSFKNVDLTLFRL